MEVGRAGDGRLGRSSSLANLHTTALSPPRWQPLYGEAMSFTNGDDCPVGRRNASVVFECGEEDRLLSVRSTTLPCSLFFRCAPFRNPSEWSQPVLHGTCHSKIRCQLSAKKTWVTPGKVQRMCTQKTLQFLQFRQQVSQQGSCHAGLTIATHSLRSSSHLLVSTKQRFGRHPRVWRRGCVPSSRRSRGSR